MPSPFLYVGQRSLRNDSMTWSVATPMCVAPSSSIMNTLFTTARVRADLDAVGVLMAGTRREELAEELVGPVDEVDAQGTEPGTAPQWLLPRHADGGSFGRDGVLGRSGRVGNCVGDRLVQLEQQPVHRTEHEYRAGDVEPDEQFGDALRVLHVAEDALCDHRPERDRHRW